MTVKVVIEIDTNKKPKSWFEFLYWLDLGLVRVKSFRVVE